VLLAASGFASCLLAGAAGGADVGRRPAASAHADADHTSTRPTASRAATARSAPLVALGRKLFMDRRLSPNDTMSCGMCHVPEQGFVVNEIATAVGFEGRSLRRNAPTVIDVGMQRSMFHDGRVRTLEEQVWGPLLARDEMANPSREAVLKRIAGLADYRRPWRRAFGDPEVTPPRIEAALAAYERSLDGGLSRFDRWRFLGATDALDARERRGFELFSGAAGCVRCHAIDDREAPFTDHAFHNTGIGARQVATTRYDVPLAPGENTVVDAAWIASQFGANPRDDGRFEFTGRAEDRHRYKTPSLRHVALTAPYMHDGSLATLEAVIDFYARGGGEDPGRDPALAPLDLSPDDRAALAAFLRSLTGERVARRAREARRAASTPEFR
jgi:cytochrome c peroxidase